MNITHCVTSPFLLITLNNKLNVIVWELKISIVSVLQVELLPILGVCKT